MSSVAHVDDAFEAELGADGGRRDAVLAGAGLGDDPLLAHPDGEQRLPEGVVDLVGAGVGQVFALEEDPAADLLREARRLVERRLAADEVAQQPAKLGLELGIVAGLGVG